MNKSKIRICYALNSFEVGGAETVALDLARSHDPDRFEVEAVALIEPSSDGRSEMRSRFEAAGVRTEVIRQRSYRSPLSLWRIYRYLRRGRFDIVHGHNRGADYWACRIGAAAGIRHLFWTRHLVYRDFTPKQLRRYASLARRDCRVIAVSEAVRRACLETENLPERQVTTIVNGIDTDRFAPLSEEDRTCKRAELGLGDDELLLLFVGRFSEQKAPESFVALIAELRRRGLPVRGVMCGYGPLEAELRRLAGSGEAGTAILGMRSDVPELLGSCDLFVSTSRNEGLPLNVMEAMSAAAPFVGPGIPQVAELVATRPALQGRLYAPPPAEGPVPADRVAGWADHVAAILADRSGEGAIGAMGREVIRDDFSLGRMVRSYEELFLAACGRGRAD